MPRQFVHRQSIAEVFVTDSIRLGEDCVAVAAQIPRGHRMNRLSNTAREVLILEVLRQASIYAAHECLSIPREMIFVFSASCACVELPDPSAASQRFTIMNNVLLEKQPQADLAGI
ncbi:MAG: AfsA-related hotdog domain-containing protein [Beutenbergiaceae bacterium]